MNRMEMKEIARISVEEARLIRKNVLQAGRHKDCIVYPGDDAVDTLHVGAFVSGQFAGVASVCRESMPGSTNLQEWRLRGMATLSNYRNRGLGSQLLRGCIDYSTEKNGRLLWCTARVLVTPFYRAFGFIDHGVEFLLPGYGDELYVLMSRLLRPESNRVL